MAAVIIGAIGLGLSAMGGMSARQEAKKAERASRAAAKRAKADAEENAKQYEVKAGQELAIGSHEREEAARQGKIVASNARAVGAASGAGGYESTIADIEGEADYQMLTSMYNSKQSARDLLLAAEVTRREGSDAGRAHAAQAGAYRNQANTIGLQTAASLFGGAMTMYERYGQSYKPETAAA